MRGSTSFSLPRKWGALCFFLPPQAGDGAEGGWGARRRRAKSGPHPARLREKGRHEPACGRRNDMRPLAGEGTTCARLREKERHAPACGTTCLRERGCFGAAGRTPRPPQDPATGRLSSRWRNLRHRGRRVIHASCGQHCGSARDMRAAAAWLGALRRCGDFVTTPRDAAAGPAVGRASCVGRRAGPGGADAARADAAAPPAASPRRGRARAGALSRRCWCRRASRAAAGCPRRGPGTRCSRRCWWRGRRCARCSWR